VAFDDDEKAVVTYVARTTQHRGGRFEVEHNAPHFLPGVFDSQNLGTVPTVKLMRRLGRLPAREFAEVETAVKRWLGFAG
jgi:mRNA interferase MazF